MLDLLLRLVRWERCDRWEEGGSSSTGASWLEDSKISKIARSSLRAGGLRFEGLGVECAEEPFLAPAEVTTGWSLSEREM